MIKSEEYQDDIEPKLFSFSQIMEKIKRYCAYQERCKQDVRCKLKEWAVDRDKTEDVVNQLVSEGYVDEERFAVVFVRGKFNIKSWGTQKITAELKRRNISDFCIKQALNEIDKKLYSEKLTKLGHKWLNEHKQDSVLIQKQKIFRYLFSKGYEQQDIWGFINENMGKG